MAKKKESTLINMLVALFVIAAVSGGVLGLVYGLTKDTIAEGEEKKNNDAIKAVLPLESVIYEVDTLNFTYEGTASVLPCTIVKDSLTNAFKGVAIKTSEGGFGGKIELMVGITADGVIRGVSVLSHSETPGLGANMDKVLVDQFTDQKPGDGFTLEVTKNKEKEPEKVDAITAATITSRAFTKAVDKAYQAFEDNKDQLNNDTSADDLIPEAEEITGAEVETEENEEGGTENE